MKYLKTHETFKEIYGIDPDRSVVILDDKLSSVVGEVDSVKFKGKSAKMKYNDDDFYATLYIGGKTYYNVPVHMLIDKEKYDIEKNVEKYNL